ncbi:MAG: PqqD family protein [Acidobacteriota bacterium]
MTEDAPATLETAFARDPNVVARNIAGEFVLVPIVAKGADLDSIFHLNRVGSFIWERLDGETTGEQIVKEMTGRFDVGVDQAADDYRRFLAQLESVKVVKRTDRTAG